VVRNKQPSANKKQGPGGDRDPRVQINTKKDEKGEKVNKSIKSVVSTNINNQTEKLIKTSTSKKPSVIKIKKSVSIRPPFK
jgi:hypothetical protein